MFFVIYLINFLKLTCGNSRITICLSVYMPVQERGQTSDGSFCNCDAFCWIYHQTKSEHIIPHTVWKKFTYMAAISYSML